MLLGNHPGFNYFWGRTVLSYQSLKSPLQDLLVIRTSSFPFVFLFSSYGKLHFTHGCRASISTQYKSLKHQAYAKIFMNQDIVMVQLTWCLLRPPVQHTGPNHRELRVASRPLPAPGCRSPASGRHRGLSPLLAGTSPRRPVSQRDGSPERKGTRREGLKAPGGPSALRGAAGCRPAPPSRSRPTQPRSQPAAATSWRPARRCPALRPSLRGGPGRAECSGARRAGRFTVPSVPGARPRRPGSQVGGGDGTAPFGWPGGTSASAVSGPAHASRSGCRSRLGEWVQGGFGGVWALAPRRKRCRAVRPGVGVWQTALAVGAGRGPRRGLLGAAVLPPAPRAEAGGAARPSRGRWPLCPLAAVLGAAVGPVPPWKLRGGRIPGPAGSYGGLDLQQRGGPGAYVPPASSASRVALPAGGASAGLCALRSKPAAASPPQQQPTSAVRRQ